ncbi:unnamed protein product [Clonostachys rhizophaga]|uniref:Uncharacterized protein n=1 Tax=Clonostachys rhizophaga TaxID=160324 RepID=A0A9N9VRU5_9HYPO|nr:unnamed protein product [Clonostachys rhizophaga]
MPSGASRSSTRRHHAARASKSSSGKHVSKTSHDSDIKLASTLPEDQYNSENKSLWQDVKATQGNPRTLIMTVVAPEQKKSMKDLIDKKQKRIESSVVVSTESQFQKHLSSAIKANNTGKGTFKSLYLLVSSTVAQLTYHIDGFVDQVFVKPCGSAGRPDALYIGSSSTFCGFKAFAWDARTGDELVKKQLTHHEGCIYDLRGAEEEARALVRQPRMTVDFTSKEQANFQQQFEEVTRTRVSPSPGESPTPCSNGTDTWFEKWKSLLATIIAAGAGVAGIAGGFWISAGGIMIKGPCGFSLAAGYITVAGCGAAAAAGVASTMLAYGAVYFIPWDKVWQFVRRQLSRIWDKILEAVMWIKDKLAQLASSIKSKIL